MLSSLDVRGPTEPCHSSSSSLSFPVCAAPVTGMYCRQHLEVMELVTGCEGKNRYSFTPIEEGTVIPVPATSSWSNEYRKKAEFNPFLKAKEGAWLVASHSRHPL